MEQTEYASAIRGLVAEIKRRCLAAGATFATAESCTGGLIGGAVTSEPGISACYPGGVVSYANEVKRDLLGVSEETLGSVGAVSPECARQMAEGARRRLGTDFAVAVTGIAGPDGGTPEKPVGLVYIATASVSATHVSRNLFAGDREAVRRATVRHALGQLLAEMRG